MIWTRPRPGARPEGPADARPGTARPVRRTRRGRLPLCWPVSGSLS